MNTDDHHDLADVYDLIGPFVLGACSPEEVAQVRAHMKVSPEFRAEVDSYDAVRTALFDVRAPDVRPDRELKRSIMAQVQEEASLFAAAGSGDADGESPTESPSSARTADATPDVTAAASRRSASPGPAPVPAAPGSGPSGSPDPARGTGTPVPTRRRNAFFDALRHPARATALAAVLVALVVGGIVLGGGDSEGRVYEAQTMVPGGATARMVSKGDTHRLELSGFEDAGPGKQYQVWLKSGDADPKPTKVLFDVDERGNAEATIPGDMSTVDDVLVTAEPDGGSPEPTTAPVLDVRI